MLSSPVFWFILITAIVIDGVIIMAWRRKRGLSTRPQAWLEDTLKTPRILFEGAKRWVRKPHHFRLPSFTTPYLANFSLSDWSLDLAKASGWQFLLPIGLVSLPVWLAFNHRWLDDELRIDGLREAICTVEALCDLQVPSYFGLIIPALVVLFLVMRIGPRGKASIENLSLTELPLTQLAPLARVSERQRVWAQRIILLAIAGLFIIAVRAWRFENGPPGVEYALIYLLFLLGFALREMNLTSMYSRLREQGSHWLSILLAHFSLIWLLLSVYDASRSPWLVLVLTLLAYFNVWRYRKQVSPVFWVVSASLVLYTLYINAWWTSIAGDDYAFLNDAFLVLEQPWQTTAENLFRGAFTYGSHPFLTNIIQAAFLKIFGLNNFAWRFSSIYVAAMSLPFFYAFLKTFLQQRTALLVTIFLAGSHYIISFSRIGYNNMQALFTTGLILYLASVAIRSSSLWSYAALGAAMGLSFYAFPGAILALPLPLLLVLMYKGLPKTAQAIKQWGTIAMTALMLIVPLFVQPIYWTSKFPGSFLTSAEGANASPVFHLFSNFIYAYISPLHFIEESHFVVVGFLDVLSAGLFFLGLGYVAWRWRGQRFISFMLLSFAFMLLAVGVIHNYITPPATRMFMLLPWFVFFAAAGLFWLFAHIQQLGLSTRATHLLVNFSVILLLAVNVYQGFRLSFERSPRYQHFITMQLGVLNDFFSHPENDANSIVIMNDAVSMNVPIFLRMLDLYQVPVDDERFQFVSVFGNPGQPNIVPFEEAIPQFDDPNTLIMVNPGLAERAPELLKDYEDYLQSIGRQRCEVRSFVGDLRFWFWYSPELERYCPLTF